MSGKVFKLLPLAVLVCVSPVFAASIAIDADLPHMQYNHLNSEPLDIESKSILFEPESGSLQIENAESKEEILGKSALGLLMESGDTEDEGDTSLKLSPAAEKHLDQSIDQTPNKNKISYPGVVFQQGMNCNIRCWYSTEQAGPDADFEPIDRSGERYNIDYYFDIQESIDQLAVKNLNYESEKQNLPVKRFGPVYKNGYAVADIPILSNRKIKSLIKWYSVRKRKIFELAIQRSAKYMKMINRIFREHNLPENLAYLAVIESNFNPKARSRSNAVGLWQFMKNTGKVFGLHRSWWHDDRLDPEKSTIAAAKYLKRLHKRFKGDWELAMAAYNSGSGRVRRAMRKAKKQGKPQNYWYLDLPRETRGYVPAFYAVATIFSNLDEYGFAQPPAWQDENPKKSIKVPGGVSLKQIASNLNLNHQQLITFNPSLSKGITPATYSSYRINIPKHTVITEKHNKKLELLEKRRQKFWKYHKVKKGDTLWAISQKYSVPISKIRIFNQFRRKNLLRIGQRIMLPVPVGVSIVKKRENAENLFVKAKARLDKIPGITHTHMVKKGDSLWKIAQRFNVSIKSIKNWNRTILKRRTLQIGTKILLKLPPKVADIG